LMPAEARTQTEAKVHPGRASRRGIVEPVVVGERMPTFATGYGHRDFWVRRLLATADVLAIFLALVISAPFSRLTPVVDYLLWGVLTIPVWIVLLKTYGLYDRDAKTGLLVRKMRAHPEYGLDPIGVLSYAGNGHSSTVPILGALADLPRVVRDNRIDRIVVSPTGLRAEDQIELLRSSRELSLKV